jgi:Transposase IS66 family
MAANASGRWRQCDGAPTLKRRHKRYHHPSRLGELFAIERQINGLTPDQRLAVRRERSTPLIDDLERWLRGERRKLSSKNPLAKAMDYSLKRWSTFTY